MCFRGCQLKFFISCTTRVVLGREHLKFASRCPESGAFAAHKWWIKSTGNSLLALKKQNTQLRVWGLEKVGPRDFHLFLLLSEILAQHWLLKRHCELVLKMIIMMNDDLNDHWSVISLGPTWWWWWLICIGPNARCICSIAKFKQGNGHYWRGKWWRWWVSSF